MSNLYNAAKSLKIPSDLTQLTLPETQLDCEFRKIKLIYPE